MMTRNSNQNLSKRSHSPAPPLVTRSTGNDDYFAQLPDLSGLGEDEKKHILDVLLRDESLREKHLSRFVSLKKEVSELEDKLKPSSSSACSLCQTTFGYLFNTGDTCPKCSLKVCKQCRLMYNVNDNGWLCKLCCKQMQLMSYSGEWIYTSRSNLRKDSVTASEMIRKSLSRATSIRNMNHLSSSDTENESNNIPFGRMTDRTNNEVDHRNRKVNRMMVQTEADEKKLNMIKQNVKRRPNYEIPINHVFLTSKTNLNSPILVTSTISSDDVDSLADLSTNYTGRTSRSASSNISVTNGSVQQRAKSLEKTNDSLSTVYNGSEHERIRLGTIDQRSVDCASVTSSEWGGDDNISVKAESINQSRFQTNSNQNKRNASSRPNVVTSMENLRETSNKISTNSFSTSRSSLNVEKRTNLEINNQNRRTETDQISMNVAEEQIQPETNENQIENCSSIDSSTNFNSQKSTKTNFSLESNDSNFNFNRSEENLNASRNNLTTAESDEDLDQRFEKAKLGSQISIASALSESKARYGLDITGSIQLTFSYSSSTGAFDILVHKCQNLARAKRNQTSDPYVKIYLLPDRSKNSKRKSSVKKNTIDPLFEEKFRYHVNRQEFETRILWISVWSQSSLGHNFFLGEIHVPLSQCSMDTIEEFQLLAQIRKNDLSPNIEPTMEPGEIQFQLTFIPGPKNKDIGTLQIHYIEGKGIFYGKSPVDAICKGLLMPENMKRKLPTIRKGPSPKWEVPLRWDGIRRDNLSNTSIEISIWNQERFRKFKLGFVRLNLGLGYFDNKPADWMDSTDEEKSAWKIFIQKPTQNHLFRFSLRPVRNETK